MNTLIKPRTLIKQLGVAVMALSAVGCATVNHDALTQEEALALRVRA